jgi:hypothetical protein
MRTYLSVRGVSVLSLVVASVSAFACTGSPTEPGPITNSTSDSPVVSRSRPFDAPPSLIEPADPIDEQPADTDYLEEDIPEASELTAEDQGMLSSEDVEDLGSNDLGAYDLEANNLTINAATAGTSKTGPLSGVIRDKKLRALTIAGVTVKATGVAAVKSKANGSFSLRRPKGKFKITFTKNGYEQLVTRATTSPVYLTAKVPRGMTVRCKDGKFMAAKTVAGACAGHRGVGYWLMKPATAALLSISLSDNDVPVGTMVNGTVTLTNVAPSGGAKILLSSTSPSVAEVQSTSVTIPAGENSAPFKVSAESAGTTVIKGTYNNASKTDQLTVTGPPEKVVAKFRYAPDPCQVIANPSTPATPLKATCTFDASDSKPAGSTFRWTLPDGSVITRDNALLPNPLLACGLPTVDFEANVRLTVIAPGGLDSASVLLPVNFSKKGLC